MLPFGPEPSRPRPMIPAMYDLLQGRVSITQLREVRVEDLLHRQTVSLEEHDLVGFLGGKVVMVTGAGGSIGAELARQVARFSPSRLLLLERSEPALYAVDRELREAWPSLSIVPVVGDVGDKERMLAVFREHRPRVVAHAVAHKHVPLMETNAPELRSWRWLCRGCGSWLLPARPTRCGPSWARSCRKRSSTGACRRQADAPPFVILTSFAWPGEEESAGGLAARRIPRDLNLPKSLGMTKALSS